ncbi:hypothetical protein BGZ82_004191 [Podila clonocystis]|nr:hypothetical protein BGZ82_004191 [Podila clonocystis]
MDLGQSRTRFAKTQRNGFAHGCHRSSGSPSSSVPPRPRATTGTPTYATYGTPFYGIENVDISSARYRELRSQQDPQRPGRAPVEREREPRPEKNPKGKEKDSSPHDELRDHREHIWAIAHEYEYGPADSGGGGANAAPSAFEQGRYKRFSRLEQEEEHPPCDDPGAYIPVSPENEPGTAEDRVQTPPPTVPHTSPALAPVSQGIYGPDSFAESLQGSTVGQNQQEQERVKEDRRACLAKWKNWLFVLMALLVVLVVVVVLLVPKRVGSGAGGGGGDGGAQGGEDAYLEKGQDLHDEGRHGAATKSSTSRIKPTATTKVISSTGATAATTVTTEKPSWGSTVPVPAATPTTSTTNDVPSSSAATGI